MKDPVLAQAKLKISREMSRSKVGHKKQDQARNRGYMVKVSVNGLSGTAEEFQGEILQRSIAFFFLAELNVQL